MVVSRRSAPARCRTAWPASRWTAADARCSPRRTAGAQAERQPDRRRRRGRRGNAGHAHRAERSRRAGRPVEPSFVRHQPRLGRGDAIALRAASSTCSMNWMQASTCWPSMRKRAPCRCCRRCPRCPPDSAASRGQQTSARGLQHESRAGPRAGYTSRRDVRGHRDIAGVLAGWQAGSCLWLEPPHGGGSGERCMSHRSLLRRLL